MSYRFPEFNMFAKMNINLFCISYRGFGKSTGRPSEKGVYTDGFAAYDYVLDTLTFNKDSILVLGRSIGTAVAINTAVNRNIKKLILVTPFTTGKEYASAHGLGFWTFLVGNPFDNSSKCSRINSNVLILHGTNDEVIPFAMGQNIFNKLNCMKSFITIDGGHHNDLEYVDSTSYWGSISNFVNRK
jgi:hypothetical protein